MFSRVHRDTREESVYEVKSFFMHHQKSGKKKGKDEAENLKKIRKPDGNYG